MTVRSIFFGKSGQNIFSKCIWCVHSEYFVSGLDFDVTCSKLQRNKITNKPNEVIITFEGAEGKKRSWSQTLWFCYSEHKYYVFKFIILGYLFEITKSKMMAIRDAVLLTFVGAYSKYWYWCRRQDTRSNTMAIYWKMCILCQHHTKIKNRARDVNY